MANHTPLRLPETMTRIDIGPYMRGLREHFGLSEQDVSERLHIRHRYIRAIEEGKFEDMPGRAYAKGYVHTYAEFLGIDADQAVEICFGPELVREQQKHFVPDPMKRHSKRMPGYWRPFAALAAVGALGLLVATQFLSYGDDDAPREEAEVEAVAEVPEDMLAEMRSLVMPSPANYACLSEAADLSCVQATREWQVLTQLSQTGTAYLAEAQYEGIRAQDVPDAVDEDEVIKEEDTALAEEAVIEDPTPPPPPTPVKPKPKPVKKPVAKPAPKPTPMKTPEPAPEEVAPLKEEPKPEPKKEEKSVFEKIADDLPKPERKFPGDGR